MALAAVKGVLSSPGATGNQTYPLGSPWPAGTTPKALILWWTNQTAEGLARVAYLSQGYGTYRGSAVQQCCTFAGMADVGASSSGSYGVWNNSILRLVTPGTTTIIAEVDLVSLGTDEFVLNWVDLPVSQGTGVHYIALGGDDITDAYASTVALTVTTPQDETILSGFGQPDLLLFSQTLANTINTATAAAAQSYFGVAKSDTERRAAGLREQNAAATMDVGFWNKDRAIVLLANLNAANMEADLDVRANWPADGFRVVKPDVPGGTVIAPYLALKGPFQSKIGTILAPTSGSPPVVQDFDAGFSPRLALVWGGNVTAKTTIDTSHADLGLFGIGGSDGENEGWAGLSQDDGAANAETFSYHSEQKTLVQLSGSTEAVTSEFDGSFVGNNFRQSWNDIDTVARETNLLVLGDSPSTTYTVDLAGSVTPAGELARLADKRLSGSVTPAGLLAKIVSMGLGGSVTPTGAIQRTFQRFLSGSSTPTGALVSLTSKALSGAFTPTGTVSRQTDKALAGEVTPTGLVAKLVSKFLSGSATPTGELTLSRIVALLLSGSITPTGALTRLTDKLLGGTVAPAGALARFTAIVRGGSLSPTGLLQKLVDKRLDGSAAPTGTLTLQQVIALFLSGSISPSGALAKLAQKLTGGSVTPAGSLSRATDKGLSGTVTPSGALAKSVSKFLSGSVTPSGALELLRAITLYLSGAITPSGSLVRQVQKSLGGGVSPAGARSRLVSIIRGGEVTPTGALTKSVAKQLLGAITPTGTVGKLVSKVLGGILAPIGDLIRQFLPGITPDAPAASDVSISDSVLLEAHVSDRPAFALSVSDSTLFDVRVSDRPAYDVAVSDYATGEVGLDDQFGG